MPFRFRNSTRPHAEFRWKDLLSLVTVFSLFRADKTTFARRRAFTSIAGNRQSDFQVSGSETPFQGAMTLDS